MKQQQQDYLQLQSGLTSTKSQKFQIKRSSSGQQKDSPSKRHSEYLKVGRENAKQQVINRGTTDLNTIPLTTSTFTSQSPRKQYQLRQNQDQIDVRIDFTDKKPKAGMIQRSATSATHFKTEKQEKRMMTNMHTLSGKIKRNNAARTESQTEQSNSSKKNVDSLHEGIHVLQKNLQTLETKYRDLAQMYERPPAQIVQQKTPSRVLDDDTTLQLNQLAPQLSLSQIEHSRGHYIEQLLTRCQTQLNLKEDQSPIYESMRQEVTTVLKSENQLLSNQHLLKISLQEIQNQKESIFTVRHLLDTAYTNVTTTLQAIQATGGMLLNQQALWDTKDQIHQSARHFQSLDHTFVQLHSRLQTVLKEPSTKPESQLEFKLKQETREISKQLDLERENHNRQLQQMDSTMTELRLQNADLRQKIDKQHAEIRSKSQQLQQQLTQASPAQLQPESKKDSTHEKTIALLTQKYLKSLRKLQKLHSRKVSNLDKEREDYNLATKALQECLESLIGLKSSVLNKIQPIPTQQQDALQIAELKRLRKEVETMNQRTISSDNQRKKFEQQLQSQVVNLQNVRDQIGKVERCQTDKSYILQQQIRVMTGRLTKALDKHLELRQLIEKNQRTVNTTKLELKTKEKELQSVIGQMQSTKAAFRQTEGVLREQAQKDKQNSEALQIQIDELKKQIKSLRQENVKLEHSLKDTKQSLQTRLDIATRDKQALVEQVSTLKQKHQSQENQESNDLNQFKLTQQVLVDTLEHKLQSSLDTQQHLQSEVAANNQEMFKLSKAVAQLTADKEQLRNQVSDKTSKIQEAESKISNLQAQLSSLDEKLQVAKKEGEDKESKLEQQIKRAEDLQKVLNQNQSNINQSAQEKDKKLHQLQLDILKHQESNRNLELKLKKEQENNKLLVDKQASSNLKVEFKHQNEIRELKAEVESFQKASQDDKQQLKEKQKELSEAVEQNEQLQEHLKQIENDFQDQINYVNEQHQCEIQNEKAKIASFEAKQGVETQSLMRELEKCRSEIEQYKKDQQKNTSESLLSKVEFEKLQQQSSVEIAQLKQQHQEKIDLLTVDLDQQQKNLDKFQQKCQTQSETIATSVQQVKDLGQENEQLLEQVQQLTNNNSNLQSQIDQLKSEIEHLKSLDQDEKVQDLQQQVEALEEQDQQRVQSLESNLVLIQKLQTQLKSALDKNKDYKDRLRQAKLEQVEYIREIEELRGTQPGSARSRRSQNSAGGNKEKVEVVEKIVEVQKIVYQKQDPTKLFLLQSKCQDLTKEVESLQKYHQTLLQQQSMQIQDFTSQSLLAFQKLLRVREEKASTQSSESLAQYKQKMQQHFHEQEEQLEKLQQDHQQKTQQLEGDLADAQYQLELKDLEHEQALSSLQSQLAELKNNNGRLSIQSKQSVSPSRKPDESKDRKIHELEEELTAKNELIEEANNIIIDYQDEKHELRAKFKYLVALAQNPDKTVSTYKSSDEIDIDYCFEAIEDALQNMSHEGRQTSNMLSGLYQTKEKQNEELQHRQELVSERQTTVLKLQSQLRSVEAVAEQNQKIAVQKLQEANIKIQELKQEITCLKELNQKIKLEQSLAKEAQQLESGQKVQQMESQILQLQGQIAHLTQEAQVEKKNFAQRDSYREQEEIRLTQDLALAQEQLQMLQETLLQKQSLNEPSAQHEELVKTLQNQLQSTKLECEKLVRENIDYLNQIEELQVLQHKPQIQKLAESIDINETDDKDNSLIEENKQLLNRLQKCEVLLKEAREQKPQRKEIDMVSLEQNLNDLRRKFITAQTAFEQSIRAQVTEELQLVKKAFSQNLITQHNCATSARLITSWQNLVKIVCTVCIQDAEYFIISGQDDELYLIQKDFLTPEDEQYLRGYIPSEGIADFILLPTEETDKFHALTKELAADLLEMRIDYETYKAELQLQDVLVKEVELKDEVEYLTGENKDLMMKTKQLALANAALRQQVLQTKRPSIIGVSPSQPPAEDKKDDLEQHSGFISNQDSFINVVEEINDQRDLQSQLTQAQDEIMGLKEQLEKSVKTQQNLDISQASEETTIEHIKGTLTQFLKGVAFTDKQNESLLQIIFSMLNFTKEEITDLMNTRSQVRVVAAKPDQRSRERGLSKGSASGELSNEADQSSKVKKGILGLFNKTKDRMQNSPQAPQPKPQR